MKNYFKFNLTGKKVFPVWIIFMVLFIIPYILLQYKIQGLKGPAGDPQETMNRLKGMFELYGIMAFLILVEYGFFFFFIKLALEGVEFKEKSLKFAGKFSQYLLVLVPGFILSIITIGIYSPWYLARLYKFFARKTSHNDDNFEFKGQGGDLFLITLFSVFLPMIFLFFVIMVFALVAGFKGAAANPTPTPLITFYAVLIVSLVIILMTPYLYYSYKWKVDFKIKNYSIRWETSFWSSVGKIAMEIILSLITIGIYTPLATLKLYKFFSEQTIANSPSKTLQFGYDIEPKDDFVFIWKELLLTIVTLGIYYPWAACNVADLIIGKTYVQEIEAE